MEQESAAVRRLQAINRAIRERIERLESRARLPRGLTIGAVRAELEILEAESFKIGREIVQHVTTARELGDQRRELGQAGQGVELGERVPVGSRNPFEHVDAPEPTYADRV